MIEASSLPPESIPPYKWALLRGFGLVLALLIIGEQFPFSYFPMYSSFDPSTDYYYVADPSGKPFACVEIFGTSTANVKKMYRARLRDLVAKRGALEQDATVDEQRQIGDLMLEYLRELGTRAGKDVPSGQTVLKRVILERSDSGDITRREITIAEG